MKKQTEKYVITYTNDSIDPIVYGTWSTYEEAKKVQDKMYSEFDEQEWKNEVQLDITTIGEVK